MAKILKKRTKEQQDVYGQMSQEMLFQEWGDNYQANLALVKEFVDASISPEEKASLATATNEEGFLLGSDPHVIAQLYKRACLWVVAKAQGAT